MYVYISLDLLLYHTVGSQAFPVAAAKILNALPDIVVSASSIDFFWLHLKTLLRSSNSSAVSTSFVALDYFDL